jgi:GT2 family glycosyltransferase
MYGRFQRALVRGTAARAHGGDEPMVDSDRVSVVIVTYNSARWIRACLDAIRRSTLVPSVVVVDNGSEDQTLDILRSSYPEVVILRSPENKGFGQGCNLGMKYALQTGAEWILQLNDDAYLSPTALSDLLAVAAEHPEFGILIPLQLTGDGSDVHPTLAAQLRKAPARDLQADLLLGKPRKVYAVQALMGAALLVKTEVVESLGGFDPLFFVEGAEIDFCLRTVISPWKVGFVPHVKVRHDSPVRQRQGLQALRYATRIFYTGSLYTLKRLNHSFPYMLVYQGLRSAYAIINALRFGKMIRLLAVLVAQPKILVALPRVWRSRRLHLTREGVFLADLEVPGPDENNGPEVVWNPLPRGETSENGVPSRHKVAGRGRRLP